MSLRVAVELGTIYDDVVVCAADGSVRVAKLPVTTGSFVDRLGAALDAVGVLPADVDVLVQDGARIDRIGPPAGAPVGLLTTRGFRDTLEIMRTNRPHPFDLQRDKPVPLVPRRLRREITERIDRDGRVVQPLDPAEVVAVTRELVEAGCQAVAICFLFACAEPANERAARAALAKAFPKLAVTLSSDLTRDLGEFERTSTTVVDAIAAPIVARALDELEAALRERGFSGALRCVQASGGATTARGARHTPAATLRTDGVGGVIAAELLSTMTGEGRLLTVEVGGGHTMASVVEHGAAGWATGGELGGWPILLPAVDLRDLGVAGSTPAWVDEVGFLQVGGDAGDVDTGAPTVTDAFVTLGALAGGDQDGTPRELRAARRAIEDLAVRLGAGVAETAAGIIRIANARLAAALRETAMSRGYQPRDLTLLAYGGGGGLHAGALARELDLPRAIVPAHAPVFSALGLTSAALIYDFSLSVLVGAAEAAPETVRAAVAQCEHGCRARAKAAGAAVEGGEVEVGADMRYAGQRHPLRVRVPQPPRDRDDLGRLAAAFEREHQHFYGYTTDADVVLDTIRVRLRLPGSGLDQARLPDAESTAQSLRRGRTPTRKVQLAPHARATQWPVYERAALAPGATLNGPAVLVEPFATTLVDEDDAIEVDPFGNLILYVDRRF